jgi:hypothetical protein
MTHSTTLLKTPLREVKLTEATTFSGFRPTYTHVSSKTKIISFDERNDAKISKNTLSELIKQGRLENVFFGNAFVSPEYYILVDKNGKDFYPFPVGELNEWEKDGSFERGDTLYKINR